VNEQPARCPGKPCGRSPTSSGRWWFVLVAALLCSLSGCGASRRAGKAPELPPSDPRAISKMAQGVEAAKTPNGRSRAIELLEQAVKVDGKLWEARYDLGVLHAEAGNLAAAERELAFAQELAPNAEDVAVALAEVRRRQGDAAGAVLALEAFVKAHPKARVAGLALVGALRESGAVDRAIEQSHRLLLQRARDADALSELALSHLSKGELDTAELLIGEARKADPGSARAERTAGLIALQKGDDAEAFRHFSKASELDPNDITARLNIGTVLLQAGVYDRAKQQFESVTEAAPDDVAGLLGLAAARRGLAKRDDAAAFAEVEKLLKRALEKQPNNLSASFNLAVLYADYLKRPADARPLFERFLAEAPKNHSGRAEAERFLSAQKR
jgi:tetratricopeptide (TPR) repeat protein